MLLTKEAEILGLRVVSRFKTLVLPVLKYMNVLFCRMFY